ncbi:cupin domain-containing protein [Spirosoma fluviale]|uniref:(S)-ureidoglycine aminohydrolase n=1 Tax=Spirosoma fluviale TaxID=1597977 RepID=A0A286FXL2_9BACT|nr:cupin domain-containing protein [Spirosoma fluviale]SOD87990.1 (S)-ureidoglycine aminohydrolase [Spirosoma fluviale]
MKPFLLLWIIVLAPGLAFPQVILSNVYSFSHSSTPPQTGYEERTLAEGNTRDFSHFIIQAITLEANRPAQPIQQLDEEAILLVKSGELTLTLEKKRKTLLPGSVSMIMPGDEYQIANKAAQPLTYYQIRYTSNEMPDLDLYRLLGESLWVDWQETAATTDQRGSSRSVSPYPTIMSSRVAIEMTTLNAGRAEQPVHTHRAAELLLILDHPVQVRMDGTSKEARAGDLIFIESEVAHGISPLHGEDCTYVSVQF